ncbi:MAG: dTDP-glucose 4,6-dehydratase [Proteobacteria bacterium]|nr:dTDP-glucose 4,6-dehydratase [Pseudomonadota bacterium]MBU1713494.1 dTDP-glucose 4,6-dehydratase [Pseudomonadota bacterium]
MKNILVTGGCGFIGSNFIRYLLDETNFEGRIINADKLTYAGNVESLAGIGEAFPGRYHFVKADICDLSAMAGIFETYEIDTICHFAAESHVDRSIMKPDAFIYSNIVGTFRLLELARSCSNKLVLFHHVSTDEVFGSLGETGLFTESTPYNPSSPYSASKAASDHLVRSYFTTYGLPVTISNCSNNYGPYQFPEKLIPLMILNAIEKKPLPVYGEGTNIRDWLYVKDHCSAVWTIMKNGRRGETYNIGGECEKRNIDVVRMVCDLVDEMLPGSKGKPRRDLVAFVKDRPGHDLRYAMDFGKLKRETGWAPAETFETGIEKTIKWYLENGMWVKRVRSGEYMNWMKQQYENRQ